jgi:hypothetical protein
MTYSEQLQQVIDSENVFNGQDYEGDNFIATVNSYKGGTVNVTIRSHAKEKPLRGCLCEMPVNGGSHRVLCRINSIDMINPIHESDGFQQVIAERGGVPYYTRDCDVFKANVEIISVIDSDTSKFTSLPTPPSSGTHLELIEDNKLDDYMLDKEYRANIGHMIDKPAINMSVVNRHFGEYESGGHGEARHTAFFGQNGSGKTVVALTFVACQLVKNKRMGLLCPDTAGDIARGGSHSKGDFQFDFIQLLERGGRTVENIKIADIRMTGKHTFKQLLAPILRKQFSMNQEKAEELSDRIAETTFEKNVDPARCVFNNILQAILENVEAIYDSKTGKNKIESIRKIMDNSRLKNGFEQRYNREVLSFFEGTRTIDELIDGFLDNGQIILINMMGLSEKHQEIIMYELFTKIKRKAEDEFKYHGKTRNGMVLLDEGPRWVPEDSKTDTAMVVTDAFNTTRKLGVGWTIISQRITAISKNVIAQCHTKFVGRGMGTGADLNHLETFFGKDGVQEYKSLELRGGYFWLGAGLLINYGQGNGYFAFETYGGDATEKIINANSHIWEFDF